MRKLTEELSKEYEELIKDYKWYREIRGGYLDYKEFPQSFDNLQIRESVDVYVNLLESIIKQKYHEIGEIADLCYEKIHKLDKYETNIFDREKAEKHIRKTVDEVLILDKRINKFLERKDECEKQYDNYEILDKELKKISIEEQKFFRKYMDCKVRKLKCEIDKLILAENIIVIINTITYVLLAVIGIFLFKKIRNILSGTKKDMALTIGRKTVNAIKEGNNAKALQNTVKIAEKAKVVLECVNNTKIINKDIALDI